MSTLTERVARIADKSLWELLDYETRGGVPPQDSMAVRQREQSLARAGGILREVLADMRQPSPAVRHRVRNIIETQVGPIPLDASVRLTIEETVDAYARENGLAPPEEQQP